MKFLHSEAWNLNEPVPLSQRQNSHLDAAKPQSEDVPKQYPRLGLREVVLFVVAVEEVRPEKRARTPDDGRSR